MSADGQEILGTFLLIRDVTAETNLQDKYKTTAIKSITDPLTGLFTRAYFEEFLDSQMRTLALLHENGEQPELALIMADIDFFKKVNDKYGHQAGDFVIQSVANIMRKTFRKTDLVCRYGGEEFLVILPSTNLSGASYAAEKLRLAIEAEKLVFDGTHIPVTISSGVAQVTFGKETYTETMGRADAALYHSKQAGRNKASIHSGTTIEVFNLKPFQAAS
jgi:diguanylate cyclase (GGDEF)-like protein